MRNIEVLESPHIQLKKFVYTGEEEGMNMYYSTRSPVRISIVTVTYNSAATLADTLQSVAQQTYRHIEHIVVDGGSSDETINIIREHPHIAKWISEKDRGPYHAMNKGIQFASGDVIGILNSDDTYAHNNVLAKVASCFETSDISTVYGDLHYMNRQKTRIERKWRSGSFRRTKFYYGWMPPHPTFFVRKHVYDKVGLFDLSLKSAADYELMLRILFKHQFNAFYLPEVLVKMRSGGFSNSSLRNRIIANAEDKRAWKINDLKPYFFTTFMKPVRKIFQYLPV